MKFLYIIMISIGVLFYPCSVLLAAPVNGTHPIVDGSIVAIAGEYDYVYERDLKSSDITSGKIDEQNTCYLELLFKAMPIVSIYTKAGVTSFKLESKLNNGTTIKEDYSVGFYTGGGVKLVEEFIPRVRFSADAQANWWRCNIDDAQYKDSPGFIISNVNGDRTAYEIQLAGILSYEIDYQTLIHPIHGDIPLLIPYAGIKYGHISIDSDATVVSNGQDMALPDDLENDNKLGIVCGLDMSIPSLDGFTFNIEGRFLDDTSISGYAKYNF